MAPSERPIKTPQMASTRYLQTCKTFLFSDLLAGTERPGIREPALACRRAYPPCHPLREMRQVGHCCRRAGHARGNRAASIRAIAPASLGSAARVTSSELPENVARRERMQGVPAHSKSPATMRGALRLRIRSAARNNNAPRDLNAPAPPAATAPRYW